jgi:branched-chain amino acid transport system ATP-binding protein
MPSPACLVLDRVCRHFGGLKAVDGVSLIVQPSERHALIGPNGAGKTTLFNLISGEVPPSSGTIVLCGHDVTRLAPHRRAARGIARTFQITKLFQNLTVIENVLLACAGLDRRKFTMYRRLSSCSDLTERAAQLLGDVGLWSRRHDAVRDLSYGEQRKLEVVLSLAGRPQLLLLDEPMAGLAPAERAPMMALLDKLDAAVAVLLIEHDIDVAFAFAENVTVLSHGQVLASGPRNTVSADPRVQESYLGVVAD